MSELLFNPEAALCVCILRVCVCVCVRERERDTQAWGSCHWGKGQTPVSSSKRGHFPGVWERPWLSGSAAECSYISNTNHTTGRRASHLFLLFVKYKYSVSNLSCCWRWILFNSPLQFLNASQPQLKSSNSISSCGNCIHLANGCELLSHRDGACPQ